LKPGLGARVARVIDRPDSRSELPIACTLDAGGFEGRQAEWAALGRSLLSVERPERGPVLIGFRADAQTKAELDRLVAAEAECCPFLELAVVTGESLELMIDGPADAGPVIDQLVDGLTAEAPA
jgi:hypothetical protein